MPTAHATRASNSITVTHEYTHGGGQAVNYGPHIWEGWLTITVPQGQAWSSRVNEYRSHIERYVKFFATKWRDKDETWGDGMTDYYAPRLIFLDREEDGRWHYRIEQYYMD